MLESSMTLLAVISLFIAVIIEVGINKRDYLKNLIGGKKMFAVVAVIFIILVFMSAEGNWFVLLSEALGKDITYNGRTALWAKALSYIQQHPIWGMGPSIVLDVGWGVVMTHAHCLYLNICAKYGVLAVILLVLIIWKSFSQTKTIPWIVYVCFVLYLLCSIVEVYSTFTLFFFCAVLYHVKPKGVEQS